MGEVRKRPPVGKPDYLFLATIIGISAAVGIGMGLVIGAYQALTGGLFARLFRDAEYGQLAWIVVGAALGGGLVFLINRRSREKHPLKVGVMAGGVLGGMFVVPGPMLASGLPLGTAFALSSILLLGLFFLLGLGSLPADTADWRAGLPGAIFGAVCGGVARLIFAVMSTVHTAHPSIAEGFQQAWRSVDDASSSWSTLVLAGIGALIGAVVTVRAVQEQRPDFQAALRKKSATTVAETAAPNTAKARDEFLEVLAYVPACALLAALLHVASGWLALREGIAPQRFTWSMGLGLTAILPQITLASAFLEIGKHAKLPSLTASGMGFFLCLWGMNTFSLSLENFVPGWLRIALIFLTILIGAIVLALLDDEFPNVMKKHRLLLVVGAAPIIGAALGAAWYLKLPFHALVLAALVALMVPLLGLLVFPVWNGVTLIHSRAKLGIPAAALGAFQLLAWLAGIVLFALLLGSITTAMATREIWSDEVLSQAVQPTYEIIILGAMAIEVVWSVLLIWFCLNLRRRATTWEWQLLSADSSAAC